MIKERECGVNIWMHTTYELMPALNVDYFYTVHFTPGRPDITSSIPALNITISFLNAHDIMHYRKYNQKWLNTKKRGGRFL